MAISWGSWEYSGGNGMRVGIDVDWQSITHSSPDVDATVKIYTDNQYNYSDNQTLTYGGHLSGSTNFTNNDGSTPVLRATKTYRYTYGSSQYGSSPGTRTFSAALSGAFNGVTPSKSVTVNIPARPYAAPNAPSSVSATRLTDSTVQVSWVNNATAGRPWTNVHVQASVNGGAFFYVSTSVSGGASSVNVGVAANQRIIFRVAAVNSIGSSAWVNSGYVWTSPGAPTINITLTNLTGPPVGKRISWTNGAAYGEYATVIVAYKDGVSQNGIGEVAAGVTHFDHTAASSNPYTVANKWKYYIFHRTTSGPQLYSPASSWTQETPGTTTPPLAPTNLIPNGISIDPALPQPLTWTFNPGQVGDTQKQYEVRHRIAGTTTWTTTGAVVSGTSSYSLPADTYVDSQTVEWQVSVKGDDPTFSPWSASATFTLTATPLEPEAVKMPVLLDLGTGELEASSTAFELRDLSTRAQMLQAGGAKYVDGATKKIRWSHAFRIIAKGQSAQTWDGLGHHIIWSPYGWNVTHKRVQTGVATLTVDTTAPWYMKARPGDPLWVQGVGAPFEGEHTVLEVTSNSISYLLDTADVSNVASGGAVFVTIRGHGGADNRASISGYVQLNTWESLWYELPFGWGSGTTPRRNGVVSVVNKQLTDNVATLTVVKPHYFIPEEWIWVDIGDPVFDGGWKLSAVTSTTISYAKTNANVASTPVTGGIAGPSGYETMWGNFHVVSYAQPFTVPSNWVMIAYRNGDGDWHEIEWGDGTRDTGWVGPTSWGPGWADYTDANFKATGQNLRRLNGVVHCQGLVARTSGSDPLMFTAPPGFRPTGVGPPIKLFPSYVTGGALGRVDVYGNGQFRLAAGTATYVSLNGITYPAEQ